jgi:hypothetical protein
MLPASSVNRKSTRAKTLQIILHRLALNPLRRDASVKAGIKAKRRKAGWDGVHLCRIILVSVFAPKRDGLETPGAESVI